MTSVSIDQGIGTVQSTGNSRVSPSDSTTYTLTATGPGGSATSSATVSVSAPPPPPPPPPPSNPPVTMDQRLGSDVQDAYFDYDKTDIRGDARDMLTRGCRGAEGHPQRFPECVHRDRGPLRRTRLGRVQPRAGRPPRQLRQRVPAGQLGVPADRLKTISYGKERPQCTEENESCWQKNRRAHFVAGQ